MGSPVTLHGPTEDISIPAINLGRTWSGNLESKQIDKAVLEYLHVIHGLRTIPPAPDERDFFRGRSIRTPRDKPYT